MNLCTAKSWVDPCVSQSCVHMGHLGKAIVPLALNGPSGAISLYFWVILEGTRIVLLS